MKHPQLTDQQLIDLAQSPDPLIMVDSPHSLSFVIANPQTRQIHGQVRISKFKTLSPEAQQAWRTISKKSELHYGKNSNPKADALPIFQAILNQLPGSTSV